MKLNLSPTRSSPPPAASASASTSSARCRGRCSSNAWRSRCRPRRGPSARAGMGVRRGRREEAGDRGPVRPHFDAYAQQSRLPVPDEEPAGQRRDAIRSSSVYLREHSTRWPVLLIPCIEGRLDGASVFPGRQRLGSILRRCGASCWRFESAALGSAWTTLHLPSERRWPRSSASPTTGTPGGAVPHRLHDRHELQGGPPLPLDGLVHIDTW